MKKRLYIFYLLTVISVFLIAFCISIPIIYNTYFSKVKDSLKDNIMLLSSIDEVTGSSDIKHIQKLSEKLIENNEGMQILVYSIDNSKIIYESTGNIGKFEIEKEDFDDVFKNIWSYSSKLDSNTNKLNYYVSYYDGSRYVYRIGVEEHSFGFIKIILFSCAMVGIFLFLNAKYFSVLFLKPITDLIKNTQRIAEGDLSIRVKVAPGELGTLSSAFNTMTDKLENAYKELETSRDTLNSILTGMDDGVIALDKYGELILLTPRAKEFLVIDENLLLTDTEDVNYKVLNKCLSESLKKQATLKKEIALDEKVFQIYTAPILGTSISGALAVISDVTRVKKLEQVRSEFVANVTHELKTPLTSIRGYIELLKSPKRNFETQKQFYEIIEIEAERLQNLIDDILALSVIEHGQVDVNQYNTNVRENVEEVVTRLIHISEKNNVTININVDKNIVINANADRLQQLIWNLTENAIKYNKPNGSVTIKSWKTDNNVIIEVSDTGIGIKQEHLARIFERFYRVDKGRSRQSGGTGLGLSIVKHILFLYDGEILVESNYGYGTIFTVKFPLKK